ncbi:hypothetical protein [Myroides sp. N17-2]|uniref:hypothetical protein n=1 Tax=Myroides sp. N17-2 TaxID=2030799 RepID=UPI000EFD05DD|nr:hypothetical protein [Myroides sp. N17-2]
MKNIISRCLVLCLVLVSQISFAQDREVKAVHKESAQKDITEIKKYITLTPAEEEGIYKVLVDKNEYLNEYPTISTDRRNWVVGGYTYGIEQVFKKSDKQGKDKFDSLMKNENLLQKVNLHIIPETSK